MKNILPQNEIKNFCIKVQEPIQDAFISRFILASFKKENIEYKSSYKVFYSYLKYTKEYQISYFESTTKDPILEIECLPIDLSKNVLIVCENCFILSVEEELYYYQNLTQALELEEIKAYVKRRLNIQTFEVVSINNNLEEQKYHVNYIQKENYIHTSFVLAYIFALCIGIFIITYQFNNSNIINQLMFKKKESIFKQLEQKTQFNGRVFKDLERLLIESKKYKLHLQLFKYQSTSYDITLTALYKNDLFTLLEESSFLFVNSKIEFDPLRKLHVLRTSINTN